MWLQRKQLQHQELAHVYSQVRHIIESTDLKLLDSVPLWFFLINNRHFIAHMRWKKSYCLVNSPHFHVLLQNHWAHFNQTWHIVLICSRGFKCVPIKCPFSRGNNNDIMNMHFLSSWANFIQFKLIMKVLRVLSLLTNGEVCYRWPVIGTCTNVYQQNVPTIYIAVDRLELC